MKVKLIDHMGSDLSCVNAARVSFNKESGWVEDCPCGQPGDVTCNQECRFTLSQADTKLIKYLAKHGHWSPFGHTAITLHVKAPIFVARQLGKHQVGMVWNEVSRRYVSDTPEFYVPDVWRKAADNVKQGSSDEVYVVKGQKGKCPHCGEGFVSKNNRTRYCSSKCQGKSYRSTPKGWQSVKYSRLQQSADKRGIPFDLVPEDIPTPSTCVYLEIPLGYTNDSVQDNSASVDRIDNTKGYIKGNIQTISNKANTMKHIASDDDLKVFSKNALVMHGGYILPQVDAVGQYYEEMKNLYGHLIADGMCAEQARMFMPQSQLTEWYWTGNLKSFANVYNLRTDSHTQRETQEVAKQIGEVIGKLFPVSFDALTSRI